MAIVTASEMFDLACINFFVAVKFNRLTNILSQTFSEI